MSLTGLNRIAVRPRGGVVKVGLALASDFAGASDPASGFAEYAFREDRAHYEQTRTGDALRPLVRHTLTMELPAYDQTRQAIDEIRASQGVVARITLASGEVLTVGFSEHFGVSYPLRLASFESTSGSVPGDFPTFKLTLETFS